MEGLIWKDLLIYKKENMKILNIIIILASVFFLMFVVKASDISVYIISLGVFPISMLSLPTTLMDQDNKCDWDKRAIAMAVTKNEIVASRYLSCLVLCFFEFMIILALNVFLALIKGGNIYYYLFIGFIGFVLALLYLSLNIFTSYLSGITASSFILLGIILLNIIYVLIADKINIDISMLLSMEKHWIILISLCIVFLIFAVSYLASAFFYRRKHR